MTDEGLSAAAAKSDFAADGPTWNPQPKHIEANRLLGSAARHILLAGGSRSGKTAVLLRAVLIRALKVKSRHACLRFRFNHIKSSLIYDTLPKVMDMCFPGVAEHCHLDKTDWFYRLPNGSEIWFGGLDDKERTEKILGNEYATIFFNECSQIPWTARNMAVTRLAQNTPLALKCYYDCNPPSDQHWTAKVFVNLRDPETNRQIDRATYAWMQINPIDNKPNLPEGMFEELNALPERMRRRFLLGEWGTSAENALWTLELIDKCRVLEGAEPDLQRVIIAVDPSGCSGEEDKRSDEVGIVVAGVATDGKGYLLEDLSGRFGPAEWGRIVVAAYDRHKADCVVAEANFGGAMVRDTIRAARQPSDPMVPYREVRASRGQSKHVRAEPISALYSQGKIVHRGYFEKLENQLCGMTLAGYIGNKSPDRADALVWALSDLFPALTRRENSIARFGQRPKVQLAYTAVKRRH